jgi:hypothetical protein
MSTNSTTTTTTTSNSNGTAPGFGPLPGVFIHCPSLPIYSVTPWEHPSTVVDVVVVVVRSDHFGSPLQVV